MRLITAAEHWSSRLLGLTRLSLPELSSLFFAFFLVTPYLATVFALLAGSSVPSAPTALPPLLVRLPGGAVWALPPSHLIADPFAAHPTLLQFFVRLHLRRLPLPSNSAAAATYAAASAPLTLFGGIPADVFATATPGVASCATTGPGRCSAGSPSLPWANLLTAAAAAPLLRPALTAATAATAAAALAEGYPWGVVALWDGVLVASALLFVAVGLPFLLLHPDVALPGAGAFAPGAPSRQAATPGTEADGPWPPCHSSGGRNSNLGDAALGCRLRALAQTNSGSHVLGPARHNKVIPPAFVLPSGSRGGNSANGSTLPAANSTAVLPPTTRRTAPRHGGPRSQRRHHRGGTATTRASASGASFTVASTAVPLTGSPSTSSSASTAAAAPASACNGGGSDEGGDAAYWEAARARASAVATFGAPLLMMLLLLAWRRAAGGPRGNGLLVVASLMLLRLGHWAGDWASAVVDVVRVYHQCWPGFEVLDYVDADAGEALGQGTQSLLDGSARSSARGNGIAAEGTTAVHALSGAPAALNSGTSEGKASWGEQDEEDPTRPGLQCWIGWLWG